MPLTEVTYTGLEYLRHVTGLLQEVRLGHPTSGVWEAADLQWWWRRPRSTDSAPQIFWTNGDRRVVGAAIITDWDRRLGLDVIALASCDEDTRGAMWRRAMELVSNLAGVEALIDEGDAVARRFLIASGFTDTGDRGVSAWLEPAARPGLAPLPDGYRLLNRAEAGDLPHHFVERNGPEAESRLRATSLYRPGLDLFVVDPAGLPVAYGLFWNDPITGVGFVEPMGTNEGHRRIGLARHVLTSGLERLLGAGATRIKINYEAANQVARSLYLDCGFRPVITTAMYVRQEPSTR